jgi:hypothetical protein
MGRIGQMHFIEVRETGERPGLEGFVNSRFFGGLNRPEKIWT